VPLSARKVYITWCAASRTRRNQGGECRGATALASTATCLRCARRALSIGSKQLEDEFWLAKWRRLRGDAPPDDGVLAAAGGVPRYWRHGFAFVGRVNGVTFLFDWSGDASLSAVVCKKRFHYPVCCLEDEARSKRGAVAERRHGAKYCVAVGCRYSWALASPRGRGEIKEGNVAERRRDSSRQWPVAPTVVPNREASDRVGWEQATRSPRSQPTGSVQATETGTFG